MLSDVRAAFCNRDRFMSVFAIHRLRSRKNNVGKEEFMKKSHALAFLFVLCAPLMATGREAKLVRYPHYHQGRIAFTYLGDIWTADEEGRNVRRITVHKARDVYPRFSPDGKWIAFSSDRDGNLDVFVIASEGGEA